MSDILIKFLAALLLFFMLGVAFYSSLDDSAIMDEVSHLPAGYSYVTQGDMRINPEHPPLVKDLAGGTVWLASKIYDVPIVFPSSTPAWLAQTRGNINSQWDFGFDFMYKKGNLPDFMLFAGRLPMLLILLVLGIYIFKWTKEIFGKQASLLTLFLFAFSPTFLAHGRFVTTDVAAAAGFFIALYYFIHWLKKPNATALFLAALFFGVAQLTKFSLFLLVPLFGFLLIAWIVMKIISNKQSLHQQVSAALYKLPETKDSQNSQKIILRYLGGFVFILIFGYGLVVTPFYYFHIKNLPPQKQQQITTCILASYAGGPLDVKEREAISGEWCMEKPQEQLAACKKLGRITRCPADLAIWMSDKSAPFRAFGYYLLGLVMVIQRATGGNTTYFLGQVSAAGWPSYFPFVYIIKESLALHILTLFALATFAYYSLRKKSFGQNDETPPASFGQKISLWLVQNFESFAMLVFVAFYWLTSVTSPLNIGVRHVLPTFPFIYILVSAQVIWWARNKKREPKALEPEQNSILVQPAPTRVIYNARFREHTTSIPLTEKQKGFLSLKYGLIFALLIWQSISVLAVYPYFLSYFNESSGGPKNGYKFVVDSNLDWGQDLRRLKTWVDEQNISKIYVDYFGGGDAKYYLGDKFAPWWGDRNPSDLEPGDWLAVSATLLQGGRGQAVPGHTSPTGYYNWLNEYEPVITIGHSIFIYQIP